MEIGKINKIGIALAAYKPNPLFFKEQLESIREQTFQNYVCVVSFDSPMAELMESAMFSDFKSDSRFVFVQNPHQLGHKKNFQTALQVALKHSVDAIAFSDQDDIWYPKKLAVCVQKLTGSPLFSLVHSDMHVLCENQVLSETAWALERRGVQNVQQHHLLVRNVVAGCSVLMDVNLAKKFPNIPVGAPYHDHWYALAASTLGKVIPIFEPLYAYRQHGNNVLAVTPYRGVANLGGEASPTRLINKTICLFQGSFNFSKSAEDEGLPLTLLSKTLFLNRWDFGLSLLMVGLKKLPWDPALARACFARFLGKIFDLTLGNKQKSSLPHP